jgi:hypothetical protein
MNLKLIEPKTEDAAENLVAALKNGKDQGKPFVMEWRQFDAQAQREPRGEHAPRDGIRRHPGVALLHRAFDIRPIFEADSGQATPAQRDTPLAIAVPLDAPHPKVFEVLPVVYDVLAAIDEWTDRSTLGATPEADRLICDLAAHGLIEVRG